MSTIHRLTASLLFVAFVLVACGDEGPSDDAGEPRESPAADACSTEEVTTDSGLKYRDIECGTGAEAQTSSTVEVHYVGKLTNGKVFDSSRERGQPATFPLDGVIPGFREGIAGMKEGGVRELTIPPDLGYGAAGSPPAIPPNSTLVFEVELIKVVS